MIPSDGLLDVTEGGLKHLAAEYYHDVQALAERFTAS
jgi:hypothetical protein